LLESYKKDIKNANVEQADSSLLRNLEAKLETLKNEYRLLYSSSASF
jgi:hypothetical protein